MALINELSIPKTKGRLASTVKLKTGIDVTSEAALLNLIAPGMGNLANNVAIGSLSFNSVAQVQSQLSSIGLQEIGSIQEFSRDQAREADARYALGRNSMEPLQNIPMKIVTQLTLKRVVLYNLTNVQMTFGFFPGHLLYQQFPFIIQEEQYKIPDSAGQQSLIVGGGTTVYQQTGSPEINAINIYLDCWFLNNNIKYDSMANDQLVIQEAKIRCGRMLCFDGSNASQRDVDIEGAGALSEGVTDVLSLISGGPIML